MSIASLLTTRTAMTALAVTSAPVVHAADERSPGVIEEIVVAARNIEEPLQVLLHSVREMVMISWLG